MRVLTTKPLDSQKVDAHPNIVKVLGATDDPFIGFGLVLELALFGNLYELLEDKSRELTWLVRVQILDDVASGVVALHSNRREWFRIPRRGGRLPRSIFFSISPSLRLSLPTSP